ncbi:hypothetical protein F5X68DRAFT_215547 [Plectosphaerella plurivora]|uniref:Uncharacterized protein n=1 Tax=Plectosphaerella plurivora TaxID=936078 RepID=A0A9P8V3N7_9PEZI|nr:hypothetical protein F5X68DRAFT_215547 [Plectosphaerella plurivora]
MVASTDDLPLALRRTRRSNVGIPAAIKTAESTSTSSIPKTPRKTSKRRVRFSDPGPGASTPARGLTSTGLTPMVRRTSLGKVATTNARRQSTPARTVSGSGLDAPDAPSPLSGEVHFLPLRQVLDGRIQRRIRRRGLSEEMNSINEEKRAQNQKTKEEMCRLRSLLKEKDAEIYQLQNATIVLDTDRIWELERQVDELRDQLDNRTIDNSRTIEWTLAARDPYADDFMDTADDADDFGEATCAELVCGTPSRTRASFPSPPLTSPARPSTPSYRRQFMPQTPAFHHTGVQADLPDPDKQRLEDELASLQLEVAKLTATLDSYSSMKDRLSERLASFTPPQARQSLSDLENPHQPLEDKLERLFQSLSDKTAAMLELTSRLSALGFPGNDGSEMLASLASGFRTARLELEYLTPGEIELPLSSHGAEVLDLILTRLRDLAKKAIEDESSIDEYHALELSLRQQLGSRVAAMDTLSADLSRTQNLLSQRDGHIKELEVSIDRLKGATSGYVREISELESLVGRMEGEHRDTLAAKDARIESDRRIIETRNESIASLEAKLAEAVTQTEALLKEMDEMEAAKVKDIARINSRAGGALALRDARVAELRFEIDRVNASLRGAHETIKDLRVEKASLERNLADEKTRAKAVIDSMKEELERVVSSSREMLSTPTRAVADDSVYSTARKDLDEGLGGRLSSPLTGGVSVRRGSLLAGDLARKSSTKRKRRRYDSGLGFLDEDEDEILAHSSDI